MVKQKKPAATGARATGKVKAVAPRAAKAEKVETGPMITVRKKEFMGRVAEASGKSRAEIRLIVEATLAELGNAFANGETLALPPFGKARVSRQKDIQGGEVIVLRLRRKVDGAIDEADD